MPLALRVPMRGSRQMGVRLPGGRALPLVRPAASPEPTLPPRPRELMLPVRLRLLLVLLSLSLCGRWFVPRALAYWRLHNAATAVADYALCMVGSAGPELLWQRPTEFWRLVRRRLVASPADTRPFAACLPTTDAFPDAPERRRFHQARARDFAEYASPATSEAAFSLADLEVSAQCIDDLARAARPLLSKDPLELMHPSLRARSAPLLFELPLPALGRGLPAADLGYAAVKQLGSGYLLATGRDANLAAYWSRDGGRSWSPSSADDLAAELRIGSCSVANATTSFRLSVSGDALLLESWQRGQLSSSASLASAERRLLGFSCDAEAAVAILSDDARREPAGFRVCPALGRCRELSVPETIRAQSASVLGLSVARARGATIVAASRAGIVRVFSSRDDGQTWTPPVVAYDASEATDSAGAGVPTRLLSLGDRVLLYAGAEREHPTYAVLASDDFGASWHSF
ncbi:MAG: sialidase family protein [Deltaproteobacteria bacterium]